MPHRISAGKAAQAKRQDIQQPALQASAERAEIPAWILHFAPDVVAAGKPKEDKAGEQRET